MFPKSNNFYQAMGRSLKILTKCDTELSRQHVGINVKDEYVLACVEALAGRASQIINDIKQNAGFSVEAKQNDYDIKTKTVF